MTHEIRELNINELDAVTGGCECPIIGSRTPDTGLGSGLFWGIVMGIGSAAATGAGAVAAAGTGAIGGRPA